MSKMLSTISGFAGRFRPVVVTKTAISISLLIGSVVFVAVQYGFGGIAFHLQQMSAPAIVVIAVALVANAMMAVVRFKVIAADAGHRIGLRRAMAAVSAGGLAGALFFQIAGQLMARGVIMRRSSVPFGAVVVITLYERIVAAGVSALIALVGALRIFGHVYVNQDAGGAQLIKILCGLTVAASCGGLLGFGPMFKRNIWPLLTGAFVFRLFRIAVLTLLVQLPMMAAYVFIVRQLSPQTPVVDVLAGSAVVMFAASVPVSFGGWGVRELSAIVALSAIGLSPSSALTTAIVIGAGSLLAMGLIFALSIQNDEQPAPVSSGAADGAGTIDYSEALCWVLPLAAAVLVLFQIYVPVGSGLLNVNLADPVVMLGSALFLLQVFGRRRLPVWRVDYVNGFFLFATSVLALSLMLGAHRFGWTNWALVNRFAGWFVLLAYAATGGLIVRVGGAPGLQTFALTFVGAMFGVAVLELGLVLVKATGVHVGGWVNYEMSGFAQNRNAFALQVVLVIAAACIFMRAGIARGVAFGAFVAALVLAGSRSGWIAASCVFCLALYIRRIILRDLLIAGGLVGGFLAIIAVAHLIPSVASWNYFAFGLHSNSASRLGSILHVGAGPAVSGFLPGIVPDYSSTAERITSLVGGIKLFLGHPIFGAGLGAFVHLNIATSNGIPLVIHSTPVWLLAELGVVGFLVFAVPALYIFFSELKQAAANRASALTVLGILGMGVMCGPADMLYQRAFWLVVGAALALTGYASSAARNSAALSSTELMRGDVFGGLRSAPEHIDS